jgi:hypothetical protein
MERSGAQRIWVMAPEQCAEKKIELEKINDIENSKSRTIIYLKSFNGMENIPWL